MVFLSMAKTPLSWVLNPNLKYLSRAAELLQGGMPPASFCEVSSSAIIHRMITATNTSDTDHSASLVSKFFDGGNPDEIIPTLARDSKAIREIEAQVRGRETAHELILGDARSASALPGDSVLLVVASPPYWTL